MPPAKNSENLYSGAAAGKLSPKVAGALARVYVANHASGSVTVIDPDSFRVLGSFAVGRGPQQVVPSWDLQTLWITNNGHRSRLGSVTPIDPQTGKPGKSLHVSDPYNMYFTPDGTSSILVDEALRRLDFRDPHSMKLQYSNFDAQLPWNQPRRFLARWEFCDLHLRVLPLPDQDRLVEASGDRQPNASSPGHATGHPDCAGRIGVLRGRYDGRWRPPSQWRDNDARRLHPDRHRRSWSDHCPRWAQALCRQPWRTRNAWTSPRTWQHFSDRFRFAQHRGDMAYS
jgi:YVTN family beta-propeller protein